MTAPTRPIRPTHVLGVLHGLDQLKHEEITTAPLDPKVALLRAWQSNRLARTYADLLENPRYRPACLLFLEDIYAARDFSQRDHDMERMHEFMQRLIPDSLLRPLTVTVHLHGMTNDLDARLLDALVNRLGVTDTITPELYAEGYRVCDNYDERKEQIELSCEIAERLDGVVRAPLTGMMLTVAKGPARSAGWTELTDFLERGYKAFKHMRGSRYFVETIRKRERRILDRIFERHPDPLGFNNNLPGL
jgi:hypothetical protein